MQQRTREILSTHPEWRRTYELCLAYERDHAIEGARLFPQFPIAYNAAYSDSERAWFRSPLRGDS